MTGWPGGLLRHVEYFVPFFVVIFYVISPTIAQILAGPPNRGTALVPNSVRFYMRLKTRPRAGTVTEMLTVCTRTVYYCGHRMWQRFSSPSGFCSSG